MNATWEQAACPAWCDGHDNEQAGGDGRVHHSAGTAVSVVSRRLVGTDPLVYRERVHEYEVGLSRRGPSGPTWLYVGAGPNEYIEISVESAGFLLREMLRLQATAAGPFFPCAPRNDETGPDPEGSGPVCDAEGLTW